MEVRLGISFMEFSSSIYYNSLTVNIRFRDINYFVISDSSQNVVQGWIFFLLETCFIQLDHFMILDTHVCEESSSVNPRLILRSEQSIVAY